MSSPTQAARAPLPLNTVLERMKLNGDGGSVEETLNRINPRLRVLQDFTPFAESLEWRLSEYHWANSGVLLFAENAVPYTINNNSRLSEAVAAVVMANCDEADPGESLVLLEMGAGSGLFARYLLDALQTRCAKEGKSYYDRLIFYVTDRSPTTVAQWTERGLFADHEDHVRTCTATALDPSVVPHARAVFLNYILDSLPATIIRRGPGGCEQLHVRTHLTDDEQKIKRYTTLDLAGIGDLARSEPIDYARLAPLLPLFEFESRFQPSGSELPYATEALAYAEGLERMVLNHGAIQSLELCVRMLDPHGFVLFNDYGPVAREQMSEHAGTQRFGPTMALGLAFPFIDHFFARAGNAIVKPDEDHQRSIHARLLMPVRRPRTIDAFEQEFGGDAHRFSEGPLEEAHKHIEAGRMEQAMESYRMAAMRRPHDWRLLCEVAEFVLRQLRDYTSALPLAQAAVTLNPWYSAWLWVVLGDTLYGLDRFEEAHEAYVQARRIDEHDARTCLSLAYSHHQLGRHAEALEAIAHGLASDPQGVFRDRFLEKQQHLIAAVAGKWASEQEWLNRRAGRLR